MQALTPFQMQCLPMIQQVIAFPGWYKPSWMKPSQLMATVRVESGWDPSIKASDYATTGSVGLMQVTADTAQAMGQQYGLDLSKGQTDPLTSFFTGAAYQDATLRYLLQKWGVTEVPLSAVEEGYNEGYVAAARGSMVSLRYWLKWAFSQQGYAFVDTAVTPAFLRASTK